MLKLTLIQQIGYRLRQFERGLLGQFTALSPAERKKVAALLTPAAFALFCRQPVDGQRHSLRVLQTLEAAAPVPPDLAAAALLHDVGKAATTTSGAQINLWWRGPLVLLEALAPRCLTRWAMVDPAAGWRYLIHVHQAHPHIGACWAAAADCSPVTCWLIAHHQTSISPEKRDGRTRLLQRLQWADHQS